MVFYEDDCVSFIKCIIFSMFFFGGFDKFWFDFWYFVLCDIVVGCFVFVGNIIIIGGIGVIGMVIVWVVL